MSDTEAELQKYCIILYIVNVEVFNLYKRNKQIEYKFYFNIYDKLYPSKEDFYFIFPRKEKQTSTKQNKNQTDFNNKQGQKDLLNHNQMTTDNIDTMTSLTRDYSMDNQIERC